MAPPDLAPLDFEAEALLDEAAFPLPPDLAAVDLAPLLLALDLAEEDFAPPLAPDLLDEDLAAVPPDLLDDDFAVDFDVVDLLPDDAALVGAAFFVVDAALVGAAFLAAGFAFAAGFFVAIRFSPNWVKFSKSQMSCNAS